MEVEQVSFNGEGLVAEGRPQADVRDRIESFIVHASTGEINAIAGNQIVIAAQVDGGYGVFVAIAASTSGGASDAEDAAQEAPGHADSPGGEQGPYLAAGNGHAAYHHHGTNFHFKAQCTAKFLQLFCVALRIVAETKVVALMHFFC